MAFGNIEIQGANLRTQDYAMLRQGEDQKAVMSQAHAAQNIRKESDDKSTTVIKGDDVSNFQKRFDAKDKGSNEYAGDGGARRNDKDRDGKVVVKGLESTFDVKI